MSPQSDTLIDLSVPLVHPAPASSPLTPGFPTIKNSRHMMTLTPAPYHYLKSAAVSDEELNVIDLHVWASVGSRERVQLEHEDLSHSPDSPGHVGRNRLASSDTHHSVFLPVRRIFSLISGNTQCMLSNLKALILPLRAHRPTRHLIELDAGRRSVDMLVEKHDVKDEDQLDLTLVDEGDGNFPLVSRDEKAAVQPSKLGLGMLRSLDGDDNDHHDTHELNDYEEGDELVVDAVVEEPVLRDETGVDVLRSGDGSIQDLSIRSPSPELIVDLVFYVLPLTRTLSGDSTHLAT
ncbi:hypothetical protein EV361DRAFT_989594 [Lentinula raphanica]|nr:hypothetical protein EV361DRAFT_989594 [Lentinula raphanica]